MREAGVGVRLERVFSRVVGEKRVPDVAPAPAPCLLPSKELGKGEQGN
jgi:hypothetical protein